jgi:hypothetical protein
MLCGFRITSRELQDKRRVYLYTIQGVTRCQSRTTPAPVAREASYEGHWGTLLRATIVPRAGKSCYAARQQWVHYKSYNFLHHAASSVASGVSAPPRLAASDTLLRVCTSARAAPLHPQIREELPAPHCRRHSAPSPEHGEGRRPAGRSGRPAGPAARCAGPRGGRGRSAPAGAARQRPRSEDPLVGRRRFAPPAAGRTVPAPSGHLARAAAPARGSRSGCPRATDPGSGGPAPPAPGPD